ncbi:MAG TPA: hypothetical protein DC012_05135 [Escherichia sp.]|nr:hypothetical protein [Escherichia sp.]
MKINALLRIVCCERSVIPHRISWDQKGGLCTGETLNKPYTVDNYRLINAFNQSYPQLIARSLHFFQ